MPQPSLCSAALSSVWPLTLLTAPPQHPHPPPQAVLYSAGIPGSPSREHASSRAQLIGVPSPPRPAEPSTMALCACCALSFLAPAAPCSVSLLSFFSISFPADLAITVPGSGAGKTWRLAGHWSLKADVTGGLRSHSSRAEPWPTSLLGLWPLPAQDTSQKSTEHRVRRE